MHIEFSKSCIQSKNNPANKKYLEITILHSLSEILYISCECLPWVEKQINVWIDSAIRGRDNAHDGCSFSRQLKPSECDTNLEPGHKKRKYD